MRPPGVHGEWGGRAWLAGSLAWVACAGRQAHSSQRWPQRCSLAPAALPAAAVCAILARAFHPRVSALVICTFACYAAWTVVLTKVRPRSRTRTAASDSG